MDIQRKEMGSVTVLRPVGNVDLEGVDELRLVLLQCLKDKRSNLVVNVAGVRYISYLGIGVLLERMRQCRVAGGDLRLCGLNLYVQRTLEMASVSGLFAVYETEAQARDSFKRAA